MKNRLSSIGIMCLLVTTGFIGFIHFGSENAQGATSVSGPIITDTTWNLGGSPYIVVGDVTVVSGVTLIIEPRVEVRFDGFYYLTIDGTLTAIGTDTMRIIMTSNKASPAPSDWKSIRVTSTGHVEIKYCDVSYSASGIYLFPSSNNIIINNTLSNNRFGIIIRSSSNNIIINNALSNNGVGIKLSLSSNNTITNNHFTNEGIEIRGDQLPHFNSHTIPDNNIVNGKPLYYYKDRSGINIDGIPVGQLILANCTDVDVKNIQINDTDLGIVAAYSTYITIVNNNIFSNHMGFYLYESSNNTIANNDVLNSGGEYAFSIGLELSSNNIITNNNVSLGSGGIMLDLSSNNNLVTNNRVSFIEEWGIQADDTSNNNIITNNLVSNTKLGISLTFSSSNNTLTGNNVLNGKYGIYVGDSSYNVIMGNNISNNDIYGIYLDDSINPNYPSNNLIYHNNIINNAVQAADDRNENSWDNGYPSGGNFWSDFDEPVEGAYDDFNGPDQLSFGSDGIVDNGSGAGGGKNPYVIDSDSQDNYPLLYIIVDTSPPIITNLQPPDGSTTNDNTPTISADYSDSSGIDVSSVVLKVDGVDETSFATVTASGVSYIPGIALPDGIHTVYAEVRDIYGNFAIETWSFTVDATPPLITNLQPPDTSTTDDNTTMIGADYSDPSGINVSSVVLKVDSVDVTSFATVTASGVSYIPGIALPDGIHTVYVEVRDIYGNFAIETWSFTVDATPPIITNLQPPDTSTTDDNTTMIGADYSDPSGINESSVVLKVDGIDVTSFAMVTASGVTYMPLTVLSEGIHTVYVEVKDNVGNLATATWSFTVALPLAPITNLTTKVVINTNYMELEWEPPFSPALDHYLIYRADSATEFDFATPYNSSTTWPDPLNTIWVDPDPSVTAVDDDFYYIVRAANADESDVSLTSNTAGVWTRTFEPEISTFSLPLEPFVDKDTEFYCQKMNATYIKWMNQTTHTWVRHDRGDPGNNTILEVGEGYEIGFLGKAVQTRYTFCGLPGAMIIYDDDILFSGFDSDSGAKNLTVAVDPDGNVTLAWQEPASMGPGDWYEVYYSNSRDGFFGTLGVDYYPACPPIGFGTNTTTIAGLGASDPGARLYFMVVPFNSLSIRGASTYSIGVWTEEYLAEYDTFGIPLKTSIDNTVDWYCDNIPGTVGFNYYIYSEQRWGWHSTRMPGGAFDPILVMTEGYQISTSAATKFTFIGI